MKANMNTYLICMLFVWFLVFMKMEPSKETTWGKYLVILIVVLSAFLWTAFLLIKNLKS